MSSSLDPFDDDFEVGLDDDYLLALGLQALEDEFNSDENKTRNSSLENDYQLALQLSQSDGHHMSTTGDKTDTKKPSQQTYHLKPEDIVKPELELSDPSPNIWHLMRDYDRMFFGSVLAKHCIELSWSSRMTRTAGLCAWSPTTNYCSIRLSLPLLQLRSRKDLVETLIHEMIHALLFVTREDDNHESHGQKFHENMYRINHMSGANITVYHSFHDEVNHFLTHVWRCNGKCRDKSPYFGYVRRSMNRIPGPSDYWFKYHQQSCGGEFIKISEPPKNKKLKENLELTPEKLNNRDYLSPTKNSQNNQSIKPFAGLGHKLGSIKIDKNPLKKVTKTLDTYFNIESKNSKESIGSHSSTKSKNEGKTQNNITLNETNVINNTTDESFKPFYGKGFVLGTNNNSNRNSLDIQIKMEKKKQKTNETIEVIQID
ncbi:DNA-dependent metalloprotease dvc-1-like [Oppia nitens]|uniref:DNA-dependent metalloprotease dvc-1-like n=1 Tax=Oppia nitens TaxID=1686743 RepID=UPI0023DAECB9|nr:DNA-dependent metalloprotease dvc-1-like [Oppia nitens]